jgi:diaminopimelate decarboxylase
MELELPAPFRADGRGLSIDGLSAEDLAERFGTPLYVTSERRVRENARRFTRAFERCWSPFRAHYAVKANPNPALVRILHQEGLGADCASPAEIDIARSAGVPPGDILYTAAYPGERELAHAARVGVGVNLDDPGLLETLLRHGRPPRLLIRLRPDERRAGPEGLALGGAQSKFGSSLDDALRGFAAARRAGIRRLGAHAMIGSNLLDAGAFRPGAELLARAAARLRSELQVRADTLDIGGGFGVPYRPSERPLDLEEVARIVSDALRPSVEPTPRARGEAPTTLVAEPGRYLVADSTVLLARVNHVKRGPPLFVGVDAGMQTLLRPALYGAYHPVYPASPVRPGPWVAGAICGPVCEPKDVLATDRPLPAVQAGDLIAIGIVGAYGYSMAFDYNGWPRPAEVLVRNGTPYVIRTRETARSLTEGCRMPSHLRRLRQKAPEARPRRHVQERGNS